jgi:hypothetical protein
MDKVKLPDFDDMIGLAEVIGELNKAVQLLKLDIECREAEIVKTVMTDTEYYVNGKPPAFNFVDSTWKVTGLAGELKPLRAELAELISVLDTKKMKFNLMRDMIDVWRTISANERAAVL